MATFYNSAKANIDSASEILLISTSDSTIILSILVANSNGSATADITCQHLTSSDTVRNNIAFTIPVPNDASAELLANKYILPSGEKISVQCSSSGFLDCAISYVEV